MSSWNQGLKYKYQLKYFRSIATWLQEAWNLLLCDSGLLIVSLVSAKGLSSICWWALPYLQCCKAGMWSLHQLPNSHDLKLNCSSSTSSFSLWVKFCYDDIITRQACNDTATLMECAQPLSYCLWCFYCCTFWALLGFVFIFFTCKVLRCYRIGHACSCPSKHAGLTPTLQGYFSYRPQLSDSNSYCQAKYNDWQNLRMYCVKENLHTCTQDKYKPQIFTVSCEVHILAFHQNLISTPSQTQPTTQITGSPMS